MVDITVISSTWPPSEGEYRNTIILYCDNWNDYGYHTLLHMIFFDEKSVAHKIGSLKIYSRVLDDSDKNISSVARVLPGTIQTLNNEFCSLGCDLNFYKNKRIFLL